MPNRDRLRILQVCKKFPYPLKDGESIAIHNLSRALVQGGAEVSILAMNTHRHRYDGDACPDALQHYHHIDMVEVDNRIKPWDALQNLFSNKSYHIQRFISEAFAQKLTQLIRTRPFDVIQLETIYLAPYVPHIRSLTGACLSMRAHNVEHEIWQRIVEHTSPGLKRWYLNHLTQKLAHYEQQMLHAYDLLIAISGRDMEVFRKMNFSGKGAVVPIGLDLHDYPLTNAPSSGREELTISFIGSLDWMPNVEGLRWFLQQVWPLIRSRWPQVTLHIAGRNTPSWLLETTQPGLVVHGEVPDASAFIGAHPLMVVPLLSGSGMRAKILEGMALGKTVLTTSLGLEGIDARSGREVLVADTPEQFVDQVAFLRKHPSQLHEIGTRARQLVAQRYDSTKLGEDLLQAYHQTILKTVP